MKRREFVGLVGGAAAWPLATRAQSVKRVAWLSSINDPQIQPYYDAFIAELQRLGWTAGRNLQIDHRFASVGDRERLTLTAGQLLARAPDVVLVNNTPATTV